MTNPIYRKTLASFSADFQNELKNAGQWQVAYHDKRHTKENEFVILGNVSLEFDSSYKDSLKDVMTVPFVFEGVQTEPLVAEVKRKSRPLKGNPSKDESNISKIITDQLWESFFRLGLKGFDFEQDDLTKLV